MKWNYRTPGIPEELFITGKVPITKTEVRVITLSKLRLEEDSTALDIGCGTGSVTIEMAQLCPRGTVYALDHNEEAVALTKQNVEKFELHNVQVIQGKAPESLPDKMFDRIFIGGGSKNLKEILSYSYAHLREGGILAANAILLDSAYHTLQGLKEFGFSEIECTCINVSRSAAVEGWMMKALNPIYVINARKQVEVAR